MSENVIITGAGSGLGASLAKGFSMNGYHVSLWGRKREKLEHISQNLKGPCSIYEVDVSNNVQVKEKSQQFIKEHGSVDVLINNAGMGRFDLAEKIAEEDIHSMIDTNIKGTIFCTQAVLPSMKENKKGKVINIISTAGKEGKVKESVYCASKFGARGFTESLVMELQGTGINVYGIYMGGMKTEFWEGIFPEEKVNQLMEPDDVAEIILESIKERPRMQVTEILIKNSK